MHPYKLDYGCVVRSDGQIIALPTHCAGGAPQECPPGMPPRKRNTGVRGQFPHPLERDSNPRFDIGGSSGSGWPHI